MEDGISPLSPGVRSRSITHDTAPQQRAIARPFFSNDRVQDLTLPDKHAQRCMSILSELEPGQAIDIADLTLRFTTDTGFEFLFGQTLDTLSFGEGQGGFSSVINAFAEIQDIAFKRNSFGTLWPLTELSGDLTEPLGNIVKQFVDPIVERALEHKRRMVEKGQRVEADQCTYLEYLAWRNDGEHAYGPSIRRRPLLLI